MYARGNLFLLVVFFMVAGSCAPRQQQDLRPREQPTVPEGFKEIPFVETNPRPELSEIEKQQGFLLFSRPVTEPVYKNTRPLPRERVEVLKIFATPDEYEPLTFSIYPVKDLKDLRVSIRDLKGERGSISKENMDVRLVTYWNIRYPFWSSEGTYRNVPELLEKVTVQDIKKGECQRYWIIVHIPGDTRPGIYKGEIDVRWKAMKKPVSIPVECRVLDFKLVKDPFKHFTAYFSEPERQYQGMTGRLYETAVNNELKAMREYGFDIFPTITLRGNGDSVLFNDKMVDLINRLVDFGFSGPVPIDAEKVIISILKKHEGLEWRIHWKLDHRPSDDFYAKVSVVFREFKERWEKRGWPEFYINPVDEVGPSMQEFGVRVYKAVKKAGIRTYITKSSTWPDAQAYSDYVDVWCSQPFDVPYRKAVTGDHQYWSYPNHVAGEKRTDAS